MIDVFKGIGLDPIEHILSKVSGKTAGGSGAGGASQGSEQEGQAGHEDEHEPVHGDDLHLTASLDAVDQFCDDKGDDTLHDHFHGDQNRRCDGRLLILPNTFYKDCPHYVFDFSFLREQKRRIVSINWIYVIYTTRCPGYRSAGDNQKLPFLLYRSIVKKSTDEIS